MADEDEAAGLRMLSVLVPVYNERATVGEALRRMRAVELPLAVEILVVDDGSYDGTDKVLDAVTDSTVHVLRHDRNQGKAACIRTALAAARGDVVVIQDADLEYDPAEWPRLLEPILRGRAKVVYGSRFIGERQTMPLLPHLGNRFLSVVTDVLYNTNLSDMETGYKAFERSVLDGISIESERFDFEPEITAKVLRRGIPIYEVPVSYIGRDRSEGRKFESRDTARALRALFRYRFGASS